MELKTSVMQGKHWGTTFLCNTLGISLNLWIEALWKRKDGQIFHLSIRPKQLTIFRSFNYLIKMTLRTHHPQSYFGNAEIPSDDRQKAICVLSQSLHDPKRFSVDTERRRLVLRWNPRFLASLPINCLFRLLHIHLYKNTIQHNTSFRYPLRNHLSSAIEYLF